MSPPKMKRCRMAEVEPWIEKLIEGYNKSDRPKTVKAHVVGVCDLSDSQRLEHTDACMMFLSDGSVLIPAVLSGDAWERLQHLEERESFSGLLNAVVYVRNFKLEFDMNTDLASCQFYLKVNQISTTCVASKRHHPPSCTSLPSVRDQIVKTWRSLKESSVNSPSGVSLSSLLGAWHSDIIINILNDAMEKITTATHCPSVATPTHWHRERLRWRGQEQFIVPAPFLLIPEEQRELMTADPSAGYVQAPPSEESNRAGTSSPNHTVDVQDLERDTYSNPGYTTLEHTFPEVSCGSGELSEDGQSPWDMFTPATDLLEVEVYSQPESQSVLTNVPPLPIATSTQSQSLKGISDRVSDDAITLGQRAQPSQLSPSHSSGKSNRDPSQEHEKEPALSPPSWIVQNTALPSKHTSQVAPLTKQNSAAPPAKTMNVHSDGKSFSYVYHPDRQVAAALGRFQIPGQLIQWAVHYLGSDVNARTDS